MSDTALRTMPEPPGIVKKTDELAAGVLDTHAKALLKLIKIATATTTDADKSLRDTGGHLCASLSKRWSVSESTGTGVRDYFLVAFGSRFPIHTYAFSNHEPSSSVSLRRSSGTET